MNINFTQEQTDALTALATANGKTVEAVILEWADGHVDAARARSAAQLKTAADALPYEKRQELIATVQSFIAANA